jgi:hypothetical protein
VSIQLLSADEFRRELAGLNSASFLPQETEEEMKNAAIEMCYFLAQLYSKDMDRVNLWERIGNGLKICSEKCGGDWEAMLSMLLDYVGANSGAVAGNVNILNFIAAVEKKPEEWHTKFVRLCGNKHFIIVVHARQAWKNKEGGA